MEQDEQAACRYSPAPNENDVGGGITMELSDPAHRTLGKPETLWQRNKMQNPGSLQRLVRRRALNAEEAMSQAAHDQTAYDTGRCAHSKRKTLCWSKRYTAG